MRANIDLDAQAYTFASTYASAKGIPLGAAISELLRRAEQAPEPAFNLLTESRLSLLVRAKRKGDLVITPEMVKELSEDELDWKAGPPLDTNVLLTLLDQAHVQNEAARRGSTHSLEMTALSITNAMKAAGATETLAGVGGCCQLNRSGGSHLRRR